VEENKISGQQNKIWPCEFLWFTGTVGLWSERFFVKTAGHQIEYVKQATFMQTGASRMGLSDGQPLEVGYSLKFNNITVLIADLCSNLNPEKLGNRSTLSLTR
jgi:hypothetical protein